MKRITFTLFFFVFLIVRSIGQEMISDIKSEGSNVRNYVETVRSTNYLITIFQNDEITVKKIISVDSLIFLSSNYFSGISGNRDIKIIEGYILFPSGNNIVSYNFIDNDFTIIEIPKGYNFNYFKLLSEEHVVLSVDSDSSNINRNYLLDYKNGKIFDNNIGINNDYIHQKKGDFLLIKTYDFVNRKNTYALLNYKTNEVDTLVNSIDYYYYCYFYLGEKKMWYFNNAGYLYSYDYLTKEKKKNEVVKPGLKRKNKILKENNKLYVFNTNKEFLHLQILDLDSNKLIKEINDIDNHNMWDNTFSLINGKVIGADFKHDIIVFDTKNQKYTSFNSSINRKFKILNTGEILNYYKGEFSIINLSSLKYKIYKSNNKIPSFHYYSFLKINGNYIATIENERYDIRSLYLLEKTSTESGEYSYDCSQLDKFDSTNSGLSKDAKIVLLNNEIVVVDKNIYRVNIDSTLKVNKYDLSSRNEYRLDFKMIYYIQVEKNDTIKKIMGFDGVNTTEIASFISNNNYLYRFNDFSVIGDFVYFVNNDNKLFRYDTVNDTTELVSDHIINFFYYNEYLYKTKDNLYFKSNGLKIIRNNQTPKLLTEKNIHYKSQIAKMNDETYLILANGINHIKDDKLEKVIEIDYSGEFSFRVDEEKQNIILIHLDNNTFYHFHKNSVTKTITSNKLLFFNELSNGYFIFHDKFYNCNTRKTSIISPAIKDESINKVFVFKTDTFLLTRTDLNPKDTLKIYSAKNNLKKLKLINSFPNVGYLWNVKFQDYGESGFLYAGNYIFYVDKNHGFHRLSNVIGSAYNSNFIRKNEYVYFIAIDKIKGRQVFRVKAQRPLNEKNINEKHDLSIYPNPVNNYLSILSNSELIGKYNIYSIDGHNLRSGIYDGNRINTASLNSGTYILTIKNNQKQMSSIFIKQ